MKGQLPLELYLPPSMNEEDFLVSSSHKEAVDWVRRWPDWPGSALVLVGSAGCGKTHLGTVWSKRAGGARIIERGRCPDTQEVGEGCRCFVDDVDLASPDSDEMLLHLHNVVTERNGHLLYAASTPPAQWQGRLPDLISRLSAAPNIRIHPPDDSLLSAVIVKMFADLQLDVSVNVLRYIMVRIERSFAAARSLVEDIGRASLAARCGVTLPLVRDVLEQRANRAE